MNIHAKLAKSFLLPLLLTFLLVSMQSKRGIAQDAILSQFFSSPVYLNPAFAGTGDGFRAVLNFRSHPLPDASNLSFFNASVDGYVPSLFGGVAVIASSDYQGNLLWTNQFSAAYAYHLQVSRDWFVNFGAQAGYLRRDIHWSNLDFADPSQPPPDQDWKHSADFAAGVLFHNDWLYGGLAAHHLTSPQISLFDDNHKLATKYTAHAGAYITPGGRGRAGGQTTEFFISPNVIYQNQDPYQRINYGMYFGIESVMAGLWYRQDLENSNTMIFLVGLRYDRFNIGYSYDYSFSGFTDATHGIHEISLSFSFLRDERRGQVLRCPSF